MVFCLGRRKQPRRDLRLQRFELRAGRNSTVEHPFQLFEQYLQTKQALQRVLHLLFTVRELVHEQLNMLYNERADLGRRQALCSAVDDSLFCMSFTPLWLALTRLGQMEHAGSCVRQIQAVLRGFLCLKDHGAGHDRSSRERWRTATGSHTLSICLDQSSELALSTYARSTERAFELFRRTVKGTRGI